MDWDNILFGKPMHGWGKPKWQHNDLPIETVKTNVWCHSHCSALRIRSHCVLLWSVISKPLVYTQLGRTPKMSVQERRQSNEPALRGLPFISDKTNRCHICTKHTTATPQSPEALAGSKPLMSWSISGLLSKSNRVCFVRILQLLICVQVSPQLYTQMEILLERRGRLGLLGVI